MKRSLSTAKFFVKALRDEELLINLEPEKIDDVLISFLSDLIEMDIEGSKKTQKLMDKLSTYRVNERKL